MAFRVRATADGLGKEHVGAGFLLQLFGGLHEGIEFAAEAASGHLRRGKPLTAQQGRIHQAGALVVRDQSHSLPPRRESLGNSQDGGGLAGAQETADQDISCCKHASSPSW